MDQHLIIGTIRTVTVILGALMGGYCLRKSGRASASLATPLNRITLTYVQPSVIGLALWAMKTPDARTLVLPLFGVALIVVMWPVVTLIARLLHMDRADAGPFVTASMFSNVGFTYGTFIAFVALGPQGAALGALYCASFMPTFLTLGFYVGRLYSAQGAGESILQTLVGLAKDGQTRNPILGIIVGLALNLGGVPAPSEAAFIIDIAMPTTTAAFLVAIGLGLHLSAIRTYWRQCVLLHGIKFLVSPALGLLLAVAFGYWQAADHSALKVVFIESATPCAVMVVMLSDVFNLDRKLAGALWLTTNVSAAFLAPIILIIARML